MNLTRRQLEIVGFIRDHLAEHGYAPSLAEIGRHVGLASVATVHKHVLRLVERGALKRFEHRARSFEAVDPAPVAAACLLPLRGIVAAGAPLEALETDEQIAVPAELVRDAERSFALRVRGDSMLEDGIHDGDVVIVESRQEARDGDTVVALVRGSEATLKRLRRRGDRIELQPANARLRPIVLPAEDVAVQGVVRGLYRRFATEPT